MVMGRKPKNIDIRIKDESVEQVDSNNYLGCNISSNLNCCQEVKWRIAMVKKLLTGRKAQVNNSKRSFSHEEKHFLRTLGQRTKEESSEVLLRGV